MTRKIRNVPFSSADAYNWLVSFQGGRYDPLTGLVNFRNRDLNTGLDVWMEQDPAGYVNGLDLYQAELSNPVALDDPAGTDAGAARLGIDPYSGQPWMSRSEYEANCLREQWHEQLDAKIKLWESEQKKAVANALLALVRKCNKSAPPSQQTAQSQAIADAIVEAIALQRYSYQTHDQPGGWVADVGAFLGGVAGSIFGPKYACGWLDCGGWQNLTATAALKANRTLKDSGNSLFRIDYGDGYDASDNTQHHWMQVACRCTRPGQVGGYVVIDPWPDGGTGDVVDASDVPGLTFSKPGNRLTIIPGD